MKTQWTPRAEVVKDGEGVLVQVTWSGPTKLDRPSTFGWRLKDTPRDLKLAARLVAAVNDGAVFELYDAARPVATDLHGRTYVNSTSRVYGKRMAADLRRLGY